MPGKRPKIEPIQNPTLAEMDKLEQARNLVNSRSTNCPDTYIFRYAIAHALMLFLPNSMAY